MTVRDLAAPPVSPVVWDAALGRRVVLIEDRLWFSAREKARAMLGGEPVYVETTSWLHDADTAPSRRDDLFVWGWAR